MIGYTLFRCTMHNSHVWMRFTCTSMHMLAHERCKISMTVRLSAVRTKTMRVEWPMVRLLIMRAYGIRLFAFITQYCVDEWKWRPQHYLQGSLVCYIVQDCKQICFVSFNETYEKLECIEIIFLFFYTTLLRICVSTSHSPLEHLLLLLLLSQRMVQNIHWTPAPHVLIPSNHCRRAEHNSHKFV